MKIDLEELGEGELKLAGAYEDDIFALAEKDDVRPSSPAYYQVVVRRAGDHVMAEGTIGAEFSLRCVRTLERFTHTVELDNHRLSKEIDPGNITDLTDLVREDILLALPAYPRSPNSQDVSARFEYPGKAGADGGEEPDGVWDALDDLNP